MIINIDIKNYLPHRKPMLMVDWISKMNNEIVETTFEIKADNIFVTNNLFSETGLIENAAQTCSSVLGQSYFVDENKQDKIGVEVIGFISAIKTVKIFMLPKVGDTIITKANLISKYVTDDYSLSTLNCKTFNENKLLLEAEINLFIKENKNQ